MNEILQNIGTFGFPVVMCLLVWYDNRKLGDKMTELVQANTKAMVELTEVIRKRDENQ